MYVLIFTQIPVKYLHLWRTHDLCILLTKYLTDNNKLVMIVVHVLKNKEK